MFRLIFVLSLLSSQMLLHAQCRIEFQFYSKTTQSPVFADVFQDNRQLNDSPPVSRFEISQQCGTVGYFSFISEAYSPLHTKVQLNRDTIIRLYFDAQVQTLPDMEVLASRLPGNVLPAVSKISSRELQKINTGKDLPYLMESLPSVVSTSDAGNQLGYTGLRIRGSDQTRINVTLNGVPVNDAETQNVFWVDLPDLSSSVDHIQVQRGVGTNSYGAGSFGANISIITRKPADEPYLSTAFSGGSYNTFKKSVMFGTGLLNRHFSFEGRWSGIDSDGYIDRATSHLNSLFGNLNYINRKNTIRLIAFSGNERTYQSWYGTPESVLTGDPLQMNAYADRNGLTDAERKNLLESGRTYNYYQYKDQTDNYGQNYYQLIWSSQLSDNLLLTSVAHLTTGKGYYEEWKENDEMSDYGLQDLVTGQDTITNANIVRKRWLDNKFYGINSQLKYEQGKLFISGGITAYKYDGMHFGEISWIDNYPDLVPGYRYYSSMGQQGDYAVFSKLKYSLMEGLDVFADLQYRFIDYNAKGRDNDLQNFDFDKNYRFFNPKLGISYRPIASWTVNASFGRSNSQPFRDDFINAKPGHEPKAEQLTDFELEIQKRGRSWSSALTFYNMHYKDQLVLTGELNDVGAAIRTNVADSYRRGVEFQLNWKPLDFLKWSGNCSFSSNKIKKFDYLLYNYDEGTEEVTSHSNSPISFSPNTVAFSELVFSYKGFELGTTVKYVGRQYLDNTGSADRSLKQYTVLNAMLSWSTRLAVGSDLSLSAQVFNLADRKYSSGGYTYSYVYGGLVTENFYYPQAGRHFMLSCRLDF